MRFKQYLVVLILVLLQSYTIFVVAKEAVPMSADPEMEKTVNKISSELRCLVCQNQTIADSHAELAVDLKNQVREMVASGKTEDDIVAYMVQRYGDFVRYRPPVNQATILLWVGPFLLMAAGIVLLYFNLKKRRTVIVDAPLSDEESGLFDAVLAGKKTSPDKTEASVDNSANKAVKDNKS